MRDNMGRLPTRAPLEEVWLAASPLCEQLLLSLIWEAAALHRGEMHFSTCAGDWLLPGIRSTWGSHWFQNDALALCLPFPVLHFEDCVAHCLLHYVVCYAACDLHRFSVASLREEWYLVQLWLARSILKLLQLNPPEKPIINWMCCLLNVFNKKKIKFM